MLGKINIISPMRKILIIPSCMAALLILGASSTAFGQYKRGSVEDKLIELDKAWTFAELKGDKKTAAAMVADDYVGTTQRGVVEDKTQYLASLAPNSDMVKLDDYKVRIFGNTAIMTHRGTVEGVRNIKFRSTHIWMKRGGKWLIVAHHGGMIAPDEEPESESADK
ncbi:MAG: nuclear transport factor 2 family protein [Acidobacteria bacterium]|nr:nuclear transport factor 2 family protein [Acidobacteriota bacterium]